MSITAENGWNALAGVNTAGGLLAVAVWRGAWPVRGRCFCFGTQRTSVHPVLGQ